MRRLLFVLILSILLPSAVTADQWSIHYELDKDHYHPGDNGTLTFTYEGDMDVSVYFLSLNIEGVGIYEVTPAPSYEYKTGGKPLVVTIPFSIPPAQDRETISTATNLTGAEDTRYNGGHPPSRSLQRESRERNRPDRTQAIRCRFRSSFWCSSLLLS
jgi:hypothetical protein